MPDRKWNYQGVNFVCDDAKQSQNLHKHGIDLIDASTVFFDPLALVNHDLEHSASEDRFCILGRSEGGRLLFVSYTVRGETVRIISARRAARHEVKKL